MQKFQIDQYDMILGLEKHLKDNAALIAANAPLTATKTLLSSKITALAGQVALQLINPTGLTVEKANLRTSLEEKAFIIAAACRSYASANSKPELYNRCNFTKSEFSRFRDAEIVGVTTNLYNDATANLTALAPFGITTAVLTAFQTAATTFSTVMKNPAEGIAKRAAATEQITVMLPEIIDFINTRLDNDVVSMILTQPNFVAVYDNMRAISDSPTTTLSLTITTLDASTNLPVPNVNLEIVGESIARKSGDRGYNRVQNLVAGSHTVKATHPNYETLSQSFTVVSGETTELVLQLVKVINS